MAKTAKTFRLSEQAVARLKSMHETTGTNETAIIEIALALFEREIEQKAARLPDVNSFLEDAENERELAELENQIPALKGMHLHPMIQTPNRKKRKRRK